MALKLDHRILGRVLNHARETWSWGWFITGEWYILWVRRELLQQNWLQEEVLSTLLGLSFKNLHALSFSQVSLNNFFNNGDVPRPKNKKDITLWKGVEQKLICDSNSIFGVSLGKGWMHSNPNGATHLCLQYIAIVCYFAFCVKSCWNTPF